jgi:MYXO-CTERM domain-containing protein
MKERSTLLATVLFASICLAPALARADVPSGGGGGASGSAGAAGASGSAGAGATAGATATGGSKSSGATDSGGCAVRSAEQTGGAIAGGLLVLAGLGLVFGRRRAR